MNNNYYMPDGGQPLDVKKEKQNRQQNILNDKTLNVWQKKVKLDELDKLFPGLPSANTLHFQAIMI